MSGVEPLARNDPRQYDQLVDEWSDPHGAFAMLHWIAGARSHLIPPASASQATFVDIACGGGLMAPHVAEKGYAHIGIDITASALERATTNGVMTAQCDVAALPLADECADVVCAGEILEHVYDMGAVVAESCRVLKRGGTMIIDTIANTAIARFLAVDIAERVPGAAPKGIHDPKLFVDRAELIDEFAKHGVELQLRGLRPSVVDLIEWKLGRRDNVRMRSMRTTSVLFQGWGIKQ